MENGCFCQSPALRKRDYCYFHIEFRARRLKMARARASRQQWWLDLPAIEDMRSCQAAVTRLTEAIAAQVIEPGHARLLMSSLRLASSNFKARKAWEGSSDYENDRTSEFVAEYAGFEACHDLPSELDLDEDPLKAFPMPEKQEPASPAISEEQLANRGSSSAHALVPQVRDLPLVANLGEVLADAATPIPGTRYHVTAEDMELIELAECEGEQAAMQRATELERNRRRRERRAQRARYEELARNRNIQLAAQKLLLDQQRQAQAAKARQETATTQDAATVAAPEMASPAFEPARKPPRRDGPLAASEATAGTA